MSFYWKNYQKEFKGFPIINTNGDIDYTIVLLNKYYQLGYRYFLGFNYSSEVSKVLTWFNEHPDAKGISPASTAPILSIPKNIYRMAPTDDYILDSILPQLESSSKIYYIYSEDEIATLNVLEILNNIPSIQTKLVSYSVKKDNSNLTVSDLQNLFQMADSTQSVLLYLFSENIYFDLYSEGLSFPGQQYDIIGIPPSITGESINQLNNKLNVPIFKGTNTSIIWREGYYQLGSTNYNTTVLNTLHLLNYFVVKENIENINSHFGVLQFDPVSKDIIYPSFLIETFKNGNYISSFLSVNDPLLGKYQANFIL
jgi:hypothetical protein